MTVKAIFFTATIGLLLLATPLRADSGGAENKPINLAPAPIKLGPPTGKPPKPLYHSRIQTPHAGGARDLLRSTKPVVASPDNATREGLMKTDPAYQDPTPHLDTAPPIPYFDGRNAAVQNLPPTR